MGIFLGYLWNATLTTCPRSSAMKRLLRIMLWIFSVLLLLGGAALWYGIKHVLPYSAIKPYRVTPEILQTKFPQYLSAKDYGITPTHFSITTRDSILLDAWFVSTLNTDTAKGTIIVLHGIASCKEMMLHRISSYAKLGYNVVAYDSRANGISGGEFCTLGYYEKYDVSDCLNTIEQQFGTHGPYGIHGASMGGAITLQALAIEPRLRCGVALCSFASLYETMYDYMEAMFGIRWQWIGEPVMKESERLARFRIDEVRPEESARNIHQPLLLIHGDADERINVAYSGRIMNNLASAHKELRIVPGAKHLNIAEVGGEPLEQHIAAWMQQYLH